MLPSLDDPDHVFQRALDVELEKITSFYQLKEVEIYGEVADLLREKDAFNEDGLDQNDGPGENGRPGTSGRGSDRPRNTVTFRSLQKPRRPSNISRSVDEGVEDSDDDDDENTALRRKPSNPRSKSSQYVDLGRPAQDMNASQELAKSMRRSSQAFDDYAEQAFNAFYSSGITLKKRAISLYVQLCELKSYIQLNQTGFKKVLKKYDKILDRNLKSTFLDKVVAPAYPFRSETMKQIEEKISQIELAYADVVTQGDVDIARKELRLHLREHVVWERNTVWREMIGIERKAQAANMGIRRTLLGADNDPAHARLQGDDFLPSDMKDYSTPVGRVKCPAWLFSSTLFTLIGILGIFFILLLLPGIMKEPEQQNCLAMLIFVSLLWATEVCTP